MHILRLGCETLRMRSDPLRSSITSFYKIALQRRPVACFPGASGEKVGNKASSTEMEVQCSTHATERSAIFSTLLLYRQ